MNRNINLFQSRIEGNVSTKLRQKNSPNLVETWSISSCQGECWEGRWRSAWRWSHRPPRWWPAPAWTVHRSIVFNKWILLLMVSSLVVTIFIFDYGTISSLFLRIFRRLRILLIICLKRSLKSAKFKCSHLRVLVSIRLDENVRQQRVQKTFRQEHVKLVFQMFGNWTFWR